MRLAPAVLPLLATLLITLAACAEFPALDGSVLPTQANTPFPDMVPLASLIQRANANDNGAAMREAAITPRLASLRARASRLRGPVIATDARVRLLRGVQVPTQ
ncbi:hypothetical protein OAN307_c11210 [Octadecabacter antarcticus 307]|uniref:Lipoprotein n=1 Tax=Octadecabacter antarcticus 307 TaxID=391626 RepID=M9R4X9_9RHOB|nr:hypothetical protein [Octadecabacter antarcticus]AGI66823.1 hypothetical protein OAN307_c11210 [Octadecabacter antarcticus 307]